MKTWMITGYRIKDGEREDVIKYLIDNDEAYVRGKLAELNDFAQAGWSFEARRDFYRKIFRTSADVFDGTESWELTSV
jgi:hypothetical protein